MNCMKKNLLEMVQVNVPDFFILMKSEKWSSYIAQELWFWPNLQITQKNLHVFWPISSK